MPNGTDRLIVERYDPGFDELAATCVRLGVLLGERHRQSIHRRLCFEQTHIGFEMADDGKVSPTAGAVVTPDDGNQQRHPPIGHLQAKRLGSAKVGGHHTDDNEPLGVERHRLADDRRIATPSPLPETMAQDRQPRLLRTDLIFGKGAPDKGSSPSEGKEIARYAGPCEAFGLSVPRDVEIDPAHGSE